MRKSEDFQVPGTNLKFDEKYISVSIAVEVGPQIANISSAIVRTEVEKTKEIVPQLQTAFIDNNKHLIALFRLKKQVYKAREFFGCVLVCEHVVNLLQDQLLLLKTLENAQKDLKPFSSEYNEQ